MRHAIVKGSGILDSVVFCNVHWHHRIMFRLSSVLCSFLFFPLNMHQEAQVHTLFITQHSGLHQSATAATKIEIMVFYC